MSVFTDIVNLALPLVLKAAQSLADAQVDGATLSRDQKKYLYSAYTIIKVHGVEIVASTENPYDDMGVEELLVFLADTLGEAGIQLPAIPYFEDSAPPAVVDGDIPDA